MRGSGAWRSAPCYPGHGYAPRARSPEDSEPTQTGADSVIVGVAPLSALADAEVPGEHPDGGLSGGLHAPCYTPLGYITCGVHRYPKGYESAGPY
jgi:hypothetical protein